MSTFTPAESRVLLRLLGGSAALAGVEKRTANRLCKRFYVCENLAGRYTLTADGRWVAERLKTERTPVRENGMVESILKEISHG